MTSSTSLDELDQLDELDELASRSPLTTDDDDFEVLETEDLTNPVEEPLSYAAKIAAASFPDFAPDKDITSDEPPSQLDSEQEVEQLKAAAWDQSDQPATVTPEDSLANLGDLKDLADIEPDAELELLGVEDMAFDSTPVEDLGGSEKFAERAAEAAPINAADKLLERTPLDQQTPSDRETTTVAPSRPAKRNALMEVVKVLLALVMLAFTAQMATWWGLGSDPLGLARVMPAWFLPNQLRVQEVAELPTRPTPPSLPAASPEDTEPLAQESAETESDSGQQEADFELPAPNPVDMAAEPEMQAPAVNAPDVENDFDNAVASPTGPATAEGRDSGLTDFQTDQPSDTSMNREPGLAGPSSEAVTSTEPDALLTDLDTESANDEVQSDFDAMMDSPDSDFEAAADLAGPDTPAEAVELDSAFVSPTAPQPRPLGAPTFSANELSNAIAAARDAEESLTKARIARAPDLVKKAEQFYRSFAALAVTGTYVARDGADESMKSVRDLLSSFEFDEKKQRMIANATRNWIKAGLGDGVFAAVTVTDLSRKGQLFEVKATLMGKEAVPITLLTPIDPGLGGPAGFTIGDRILVLGVIVEQPERQIEGYSGAAATVIWFTDSGRSHSLTTITTAASFAKRNSMQDVSTTSLRAWGAMEMARRVADGAITSRALVEAHIALIEAMHQQLNAVVVPDFKQTLVAATAADAMSASQRRNRPLHGVPMTVKECFAVQGLPTTLGIASSYAPAAKRDAEVVARLKQAGAILLGKTNIPQLMVLHECDNPRYGRTVNPWNADRTCGGSSGGGAAAVATGCSPCDLGSDAGGSTRIPAHFCGVHTLVPTPGYVSRAGMRDGVPGMTHLTPMPAPLARRVEDLVAVINVVAACPFGRKAWIRLPDANRLDGLRVAAWWQDEAFPVAPAIQRAVRDAAEQLKLMGVEVVEFPAPPLRQLLRLFGSLWMADGARTMKRQLHGSPIDPRVRRLILSAGLPRLARKLYAWHLRRSGDDRLAELIESSRRISIADYWQQVSELHQLRDDYLQRRADAGIDAILCPPYGLPAFKHGDCIELTPAACYAVWANLFGLPSGVICTTHVGHHEERSVNSGVGGVVGRLAAEAEAQSAGLPVGVQIVSRPCGEGVIAALMLALESALPVPDVSSSARNAGGASDPGCNDTNTVFRWLVQAGDATRRPRDGGSLPDGDARALRSRTPPSSPRWPAA